MNKKQGIHVGTASILLIFTVLSLISFATLALINSRADYNLSNKLAERQSLYYEACHKGNAFIAAINSGYDYPEEDGIIKESIPITDNQSLDITLTLTEESDLSVNGSKFVVTQWQIVNQGDFEYDYSLPVKQK